MCGVHLSSYCSSSIYPTHLSIVGVHKDFSLLKCRASGSLPLLAPYSLIKMSSFQELNELTHNSATTFEFSNEDAQRILLPNLDLDSALSSGEMKYTLEKLRLKEARLLMHGSTLSEYWRNKKIPRGLRHDKAPTIGKSNPDFVKKWGEILNKASLDLMLLIIEEVSSEARDTRTEINTQEQLLKEQFGEDFTAIEQSIKDSVVKYKNKLQAIKLKKYKRDIEDYQRNEVYTWEIKRQEPTQQDDPPHDAPRRTAPPPTRPPTHRAKPHQRTADRRDTSSRDSDFTFDSDSSSTQSHPTSSAFLSTRRRQDARKGAGGANAHPGPNHRPWTRSNARKKR